MGVKGENIENKETNYDYGDGDSDEMAKKQFVKIASHLPTGNLEIKQQEQDLIKVVLTHDNYPLNNDFKVYCPHFLKPKENHGL